MDLILAIQAVADDARIYARSFTDEDLNDVTAIGYVRETHDFAMVNGLAQAGEIVGDDLVDAYHLVLDASEEDIAEAFADETAEFIY